MFKVASYGSMMESKSDKPVGSLRRPLMICVIASFLFTGVMILIQWRSEFPVAVAYISFGSVAFESRSTDLKNMATESDDNSIVLILMWTRWFGRMEDEGLLTECSRPNCILTNNRSLINQSDTVVFHIRDLNWGDIPENRSENQSYVFFNWESPYHTGGDFSTDWKKWYFNLTMTYRRDSDVYAPYGTIIPRHSPLRLDLKKLTENKTKSIAWLVSNCHTPSGREILVEKLSKYIPVDIFGQCGKYRCAKDSDPGVNKSQTCGHIFEQNYKFYFAFENSLCTDYVTEKFFLRLQRYLVPVVLERRQYELFCPQYKKPWYIAVDDFKSVEDLAKYLRYLDGNKTAYHEYLSWHEHFETVIHVNSDTGAVAKNHWCDLCKVVGKRKGATESKNAFDWWHGDACRKNAY